MTSEPRYPFVHVEVRPEEEDEISAALFELGATGVEVRDDGTLLKGSAAGLVLLVASFDDHETASAACVDLVEAAQHLVPRVEEVVGDAWRDAWKEHFQPFALTSRIVVRPPWVPLTDVVVPEGATVLELEPGRAFGTGLHATTSLVAAVLDAHATGLAGRVVLDAGTGSGILAFVALRMGAARVVAFDVDPDVIEIVHENAARNAMSDRVAAHAGTIDGVEGTFPWVLANIEARILDPIAEELAARVEPGGDLVLSGILAHEEERMVARYTSLHRSGVGVPLERVSVTAKGEGADAWVCIHLRRVAATPAGGATS
jgi:ribosomal protein L11 methyltransferase